MKTSKNNIKSLMLALILSIAAISDASARACFLPDSGCGEGGLIGADKVEVPCQYFDCPNNLSVYQKCEDGRTYNNGGVNVTCKEITCKLSKKDCEDTAANPNNTQCCNYDSESGCYYLGQCPTLCNRAIYDSKTDLSGDEYTCTSCKDKTGTYYYCKAKGKECSEIVASSSTSCRDDQTSQPAYKDGVLVKDLNDKQCYICSDAPVGKECSAIVASSSNNPSCSANQTRTEAYKDGVLAKDLNGKQCYICVDNTGDSNSGGGVKYDKPCSEIDATPGKVTYVGPNEPSSSCGNPHYTFEPVSAADAVSGTDGVCKKCFLRKCKEIGEDKSEEWVGPKEECGSAYSERKLKDEDYGSDGQCYKCNHLFADIVFQLEQSAINDLRCSDGNIDAIARQTAIWSSNFEIQNLDYADIDEATYTLPFEMKIVIKYKVPGCNNGHLYFDKRLEMGDSALVPRTVVVSVPKGTRLNYSNNNIEARGFAGEDIVDGQDTIISIQYFINGQETEDYYDGYVHYGFQVSTN